jgi:serine/threonine-protein kinase
MDTRFERRYMRLEPLGSGEHGEVWRAHDNNLGIDVALKLIHDSNDAAEAIPEAKRLKELEGDRILRVHDVDIVEGGDFAFLATELALASTEDGLQQLGEVGVRPDLVVTWVRQGLVGLSACHAHGFIHRDVKPANIFLTGPEWACLGDFGSAAPMDANGTVRHGGDPLVRAPEMIKGARADVRADVYSMGVTLYRLLTGSWPVVDPDWATFRRRVTTGDYVDVRDVAPHVPVALARVLRQAMSISADDRFATALAMHDALARLRLRSVWQPEPPSATGVRRWLQSAGPRDTVHRVTVTPAGKRFVVETRRATGAETRVAALCATDVRGSEVPRVVRRVVTALDRRLPGSS